MARNVTSSSVQVQGTNDNSIVSKLSMINMGYEKDGFLNVFVKRPQRRSPLINRGYYIRCKAVRHAVNKFLDGTEGRKQIISLGAGFDTTYFVVGESKKNSNNMLFVEIDYPDVLSTKIKLATKHGLFSETNSLTNSQVILRHQNYLAVGFDLRHIGSQLFNLLCQNDVDHSVPTLFLSEVVLAYLTSSQSSRVLSWINHHFRNAFTLVFEQMLPSDSFGHVMCRHFQNIGSPLLSINNYSTLESQKQRHNGFGLSCFAVDLQTFYNNLPLLERQRVDRLELFDEYEGWNQMCQHYFCLCSTNSTLPGLVNLCKNMIGPNASAVSYDSQQNSPLQNEACVKYMSTSLQMFGHSMAVNDGTDQAFVFGGFGIPFSSSDGKGVSHRRLQTIYNVDLRSCDVTEYRLSDEANLSHLMFSSVVHCRIDGCDFLVVFGGRTSPKHCTNRVKCIEIIAESKQKINLTTAKCIPESIKEYPVAPCGRWRHTSTFVPGRLVTSSTRMIVIGGRDLTNVLSDCWSLNLKTFNWESLRLTSKYLEHNLNSSLSDDKFAPRHSHSSTFWASQNAIVVSCGMDESSNPCNDILCLKVSDQSEASYERLKITPSLTPRYSHTSHIINEDLLLLVGGVVFPGTHTHHSNSLALQDNIAVVNLNTSSWIQTILFPVVHLGKPLRMHCHTSAIKSCDADGEFELLVFGGGSNNFSFGTSFNQSPLRFSFHLMTQ